MGNSYFLLAWTRPHSAVFVFKNQLPNDDEYSCMKTGLLWAIATVAIMAIVQPKGTSIR